MQASKTFRIFVSSTFSDLKEERNALQQHVFPRLRELCMQHGCRFQAIDLRWGVSEEAALDQQTMKICLTEIERCRKTTPRPNFIVLLGNRYGWRPLPAEIPADEFAQIERRVTEANDRSLLEHWYKRDDNAMPVVYCLQPREVRVSSTQIKEEQEAARQAEADRWKQTEQALRRILVSALAALPFTAEQRLKYEASATEQEIMAGALNEKITDAHKHVFCFFRQFKQLPQDASAQDFVDLDVDKKPDTKARARLEDLKTRLRQRLPDNIYDYEAKWTGGDITTDHLPKLRDDLLQSLSRVILEEIKQLKEVDPLEKEIKDHESFGQERAKFFTGRAGILQTISEYVKGTDPHHPLAIYGDSGSGKTALLAQAMAECESRNAECVVVSRFIGATPNSSDGRALLESLCHQISRRYGADEASVPAEYQKLVEELPRKLELATDNKPLIVFIDALDQLSDFEHARNLIWLPRDLPANVRVIVSTLPGECLTQLERKLPAANLKELEPMPKEEGRDLLGQWLAEARRTLQDVQRAEVLSKFAANGLPLYLKLAFEEARRWKSYSQPVQLSADIPGMVRELFRRLSADHGQVLVSRSLGYLAAAKNGLSEDELLDVLSRSYTVFKDFRRRAHHRPPARRLPVVVWSRLYFDLEAYLAERSANGANLLAFFHRQFGEVVMEDFLAGDEKRERHRRLADYFNSQDYWLESLEDQHKRAKAFPPTPRPANKRKVDELPWQRLYGQQWDELERLLTDLLFIEAKAEGGMVFDLATDVRWAVDVLPEERPQRRILRLLEESLRRDIHFIARHPTTLFQCLWNSCWWYDRGDALEHYLSPEHGDTAVASSRNSVGAQVQGLLEAWASEKLQVGAWVPWLRSLRPPTYPLGGAESLVLRNNADVLCVGVSPDGRTIAAANGGLSLWDAVTGIQRLQIEMAHPIQTVAFSPNGEQIAAGSGEGTIYLIDANTGQERASLSGHRGAAKSVSFSPDGEWLISGSLDRTVRVWSISGRYEAHRFDLSAEASGPNDSGVSIACSPDGKRIAFGLNSDLLCVAVVQNSTKEQVVRISTELDSISSIAFTPDSKAVVVSGHYAPFSAAAVLDRSIAALAKLQGPIIRLLYLEHQLRIDFFPAHTGPVNCLAVSPDGQLILSGSTDQTVRVWTAPKRRDESWGEIDAERLPFERLRYESNRFYGHEAAVTCLSFSSDGRYFVSGSSDGTVRVWRLLDRPPSLRLIGPENPVQLIQLSSDGSLLGLLGTENEKHVYLWRVRDGKLLHRIDSANKVCGLAFAPDSRAVAFLEQGSGIRILEAYTGRDCLFVPNDRVKAGIAFSPNGRYIAVGMATCSVCVFDILRGFRISSVLSCSEPVMSVSFSQDGQLVAAGCASGQILIWQLASGRIVRRLSGHRDEVVGLAFSCCAPRLVSQGGQSDRAMRLWDIEKGICSDVVSGTGDAQVYASEFPFGVWARDGESCIEMLPQRQIAGWLPHCFRAVSVSATSNIIAGVLGNNVYFFRFEGAAEAEARSSIPPTAAVRLCRLGESGVPTWDEYVTAQCHWCGQRTLVSREDIAELLALRAAHIAATEQSAYLQLSDTVWRKSGLVSKCGDCAKPLRFSPFSCLV